MLKRDLFLAAMNALEYKRKDWIISAFALSNESTEHRLANMFPYKIVSTQTGYFYLDPTSNELVVIDDAIPNISLYGITESIELKANEVPNLSKDITSTYGRVLFNYISLIDPFGNKLPYMNERIDATKVESLILPLLLDNPINVEDRNTTNIYIDEYLKFIDSMFFIAGFTQLCVPAASPKSIVAAPGIVEFKEHLLEENKDNLHDPAVIAKIDAQLVEYDKNYLKGDLSEGFLINKADFGKVRKKLFSMHGAEMGLEDKVNVEVITNSLSQGWSIDAFPAMNNSLRAGSYGRGAETMKGGEAFKWLQRASSNINVTMDDCGTKLGNVINVTDLNVDKLVGFSIVTKSGSILISTLEDAKTYIGKEVILRSPMFCKAELTDFCHICIGTNLSNSPTGLSVAVTQFGSAMMLLSMKKIHGESLELAKMDFKSSIT